MGPQRIGWYDIRHTEGGLEVRQRPGLCNWLRGTEPRLLLSAADTRRVVGTEVVRGRPHGYTKPVERRRSWHVAFVDSRGERVGPRFHFASEALARDFAVRVASDA